MTIYRLDGTQQKDFAKCLEAFAGGQLGVLRHNGDPKHCLVLSGRIAIVFDSQLDAELLHFMSKTWRVPPESPLSSPTMIQRYEDWIADRPLAQELYPLNATRNDISQIFFVSTLPPNVSPPTLPPPPPSRPSVAPGAPGGRGTLPSTVGHLPFNTTSEDREVFYRWEAFPSSRRVHQSTGQVAPWTFASPSAEVPYVATGFAAVARAALPSLFPAVFRWELQPDVGTSLLCGAVVPMHGQAGGGVEVCFYAGANNRGPIANQVIIPPL